MSEVNVKEVSGEAQDPSTINPLLLDSEGALSDQLYECLKEVFARYSKEPLKGKGGKEEKVCGREGLDRFAVDTNGQGMTNETYNEIVEYLDVTEDGELTMKGFVQLYQLQTENDASETEKDLRAWGYDPKTLKLDPTQTKDVKETTATKEPEADKSETGK
ncbi:uncharacterized protein JCM6883_002009 [Sporobolomyces salmoneus]|uniref:uncharacterized protein n=1 Tax=Sporobolomyces salmoneus TaxID=183962 RepID=UPI003174806F